VGYRTIAVGTDGSDTATLAVRTAARFARKVDGRLVLVSASGPVGFTDREADAVLSAAADAVRRDGVEAETVRREGDPDDVITRAAEEHRADLIVVGNVGMDRAGRIRRGGVPERVAIGAPADVLVVNTTSPRHDVSLPDPLYRRILVGTDGSATAQEAARKAFDLGMMLGVGVTVVYVAGDRLLGAIALEDAKKGKPRGLGVETRLVEGEPAAEIRALAEREELDLIVVGNKGLAGARRVLLGSVPSAVASRAPTDVLIAKTVDRTVDDLAPGHGGLVAVDGRRLAVFKSEDGSLIVLNPRCQHMGCTVDWNDAERTWDCPCHGSRYRHDGTVFQGPAKKDLDPERI
jgi:nucleotide-binding universal stress UspA family protein/nitrite reductase/ring-hydroxylating ferredoxin subunit